MSSHFILWVELRLQNLQSNPPLKIPLLNFAKSFINEFLCLILVCITYPLRFLPPKIQTTRDFAGKSLPILFVHGYLHAGIAWLWFIHQLKKDVKHGPLFTVDLWPPFDSIAKLAKTVEEKVQEIRTQTGAEQVILVGHSMGGLVSSYFCEYLANPEEVAKIITLSTPFKGTRVAALGVGQNAKEMAPQSPFLLQLLPRIQKSSTPYYTIASKFDNIVVPWDSALLKDTVSENASLLLEDHGHLRLLFSAICIRQVSKWITNRSEESIGKNT